MTSTTPNPKSLTNDDLRELEACQAYPIRHIDHIQPHGALLVLERPNLTIIQVSENVTEFLGLAVENLLEEPLEAVFTSEVVDDLRLALKQSSASASYRWTAHTNSKSYWIYLHPQENLVLLELEHESLDIPNLERLQQQMSEAMATFERATTIPALAQMMTNEVQAITGFDRVMVYQFLPDDSGVVIAESTGPDITDCYLGLHYLATDIPAEARAIFVNKPLRWIPELTYQAVPLIPAINPTTQRPLDLSDAWLRGVSPPHIEYLQAMGVASSMTISLVDEHGLWGLIACHHCQSTYIDVRTRNAFRVLAKVANLELVRQRNRERESYQTQYSHLITVLRDAVRQSESSIQQTLLHNSQKLMEMFRAAGLVLVLEQDMTLMGSTPSEPELKALVPWLLSQESESLFATHCLSQVYPDSRNWEYQPAGLLSISVFLEGHHSASYHILLFRSEQLHTVSWAGKLSDSVEISSDGTLVLCPRNSFCAWKEQIRGQSLPWSPQELDAASDLRSTLMLAVLKFSAEALEAAAQKAKVANRAKSEFLANMSHEIRTPLNAVLGFTDLLQPLVHHHLAKDYLGAIASSGKTLLALINDILDLSKIEAGQMEIRFEPTRLTRVVKEVQNIFKQKALGKGLKLRTIFCESIPEALLIDEVRLRQILFNLVGNALKFTEVGHIDIEIDCSPSRSVAQSNYVDLEISVIDTGIGIAPEEQQRIFHAFTQSEGQSNRRFGGTGLGLAITDRLTHLMGGDIRLQSSLGQGSTFTCYFANVEVVSNASIVEQTPVNTSAAAVDFNQFSPMTILVADDVKSNRELIEGYLRNTLHTLIFACDGEQALQAAQLHKPDLMLLDLRMPYIDGQEVAARLRAEEATQAIPIIFITASLQYEGMLDITDNYNGVVHKPVQRQRLFAVMQQILSHRTLPNQSAAISDPERISVPSKPLSSSQLAALLQHLQIIEWDMWMPLRATLDVEAVESFYALLHDTLAQYPYAPLSRYVQILKQQLDAFEWRQLPDTIEKFSLLLETLRRTVTIPDEFQADYDSQATS